MDSIDSLLAIQLPLSDSGSETSTLSTSENEADETDVDEEDNVNNEDDQIDIASDDDDAAIIYAGDVINSTASSSSPRFTATDTLVAAPPQISTQLTIALPYTVASSTPVLDKTCTAAQKNAPSSAKTSRCVTATSAAAAAAKGPPTPVIVTATPLPSLRAPVDYEPAASAAATRLSAQYTDSLRRRAETLIQKRLRTQKESVQKAKEIRQLTARLAELNCRLADQLVEQKRLVADYDRVRETAQRALGVLRVVRDAQGTLAETKRQLLDKLADGDDNRQLQHPSHHPTEPASDEDDVDDGMFNAPAAAAACDPLGLDD